MKKMKYISLLIIALLLIISSCEKWIDSDLNIDPNNPSDVPVTLLLGPIQASWAYLIGGDLSMAPRMWMQQLSGADRQGLSYDRYSFTSSDVGNIWRFNSFTTSLADTKILIDKADKLGYPTYKGVGQVLWVYQFLGLTDVFGDIPHTQALLGVDNPQPKFDTQESIFLALDGVITEAIENLAAQSDLSPGSDDLIYGGNLALWTKAAYAVKARLYLHWGEKDATKLGLIQVAIDNSFNSVKEDMVFKFGESTTTANPLYQFFEQREGYMYMGHYMVNLMNGGTPNDSTDDDPRLALMCTAIGDSIPSYDYGGNGTKISLSKDAFVGSAVGLPQEACLPGNFFIAKNAAVPYITYAELKFMEAELNVGTSNGITALNEAVTASYEMYGLSKTPPVFTSATLEEVINQKYIGLGLQLEVWSDWRRTGFPVFDKTYDNNKIPVRFPYASESYDYNFANVPLNNAGTRMTINDPVWWNSK